MLEKTWTTRRSASRLSPVLTLLAAVVIFLLDAFTPLDVAIAVLYLAVVMVAANFLDRRGVIAVSALCIVLSLASYLIGHGVAFESGPVIRCLVSLSAIGVTTFLVLKNQQAMQDLADQAALLNLTHDAIIVRDADDVITYWNAGAEALYGWTREEAIGRSATGLLRTRFPTAPEAIRRELHADNRWQGELTHTKRDGAEVIVASRWSLQRDERGRAVATMEINNDITERRRAEDALHKTQAELSHVGRVTTLGELTASIAHEVNQPLAAIVTNAEACLRWLARDVPELHEVRSAVERLIDNGRRASDVVARLRALARNGAPLRSELSMNDIVKDILPLVERELFMRRVALELDLAPLPLLVLGDRVQLQQVLVNLVMNAVQAMAAKEDGPRRLSIISTGRRDESDEEWAVLEVRDTGVGIDFDAAAKLFTAFYTTKPDGMGMGLSICRSIVEAHDGRIKASPGPERGASFIVSLPMLREASA